MLTARALALAGAPVLVLAVTLQAQAPTDALSRHEALARRAQARLEALHAEATALARRERTLLGDLRKLEIERQASEAELEQANAEYAAATADLEQTRTRMAGLQARLDAERPAIEARLVRLYKQGALDGPHWWLGLERVQDAARAYRVLSALARADRERLHAYQSEMRQLREARVRVDARSREAAAWQARAAVAREASVRAAGAHGALVASIDRQRDLTARLAGELQQAQARLQDSLAGIAEESVGPTPVLPIRAFAGGLDWPVRGPVTAGFGRAPSSRFGTSIVRNGIEIGTPEGTAVRAVHEGRVAFADPFSGFGRLVIVDHGQGVFSLYGHLQTVAVARGAHADAGSALGTTGRSTTGADALYFELRVDGRPVDPLQWLKPQ